MSVMRYDVELCEGYRDLWLFLDEVNRNGYEIVSMTETTKGFTSYYTVVYLRPTE